MTRAILLRRSLRLAGVLIATAGTLDPAITSDRASRPDIAVVAVDPSRDSALARRVARALDGSFLVIAAPFAAASATVVVGSGIPADGNVTAGPVFALIPDRDSHSATIESLQAPLVAPLGGRVPVSARVGMSPGTATVALSIGLLPVDQRTSRGADSAFHVTDYPLEFIPLHPGIVPLRLTAGIPGGAASSIADVAVDIREQRWPVLFYDARPSWMSTFVRRTIESDARFGVSSRVITSRGLSTDAGHPAMLDDDGALDQFDAVVVGAPDALTDRDVAGLDRFLRQRGGTVVLLLDQLAPGPWQRLAGADKWIDGGSGPLVPIGPQRGQPALKGSELAWPQSLPAGAETVASAEPDSRHSGRRSVIWQSAEGAGRLVVSGALDAWRYRDSSVSQFDAFWRDLIAKASESALPAIGVDVDRTVAAPGEEVAVSAVVRNAALRALPVSATISVTVESDSGSMIQSIAGWPGESPGELRAWFRAPVRAGAYRVAVASGGQVGSVPLVVLAGAAHPVRDRRELLAMWSGAHGGAAVAESKLNDLPGIIRAAISPVARRERWHPMRSPWWLLVFVAALSTEWWLRRRQGLA